MKANQNFVRAEEAVSPVIGVILMVAITVVLGAVVFVLVGNLTDSSESTPSMTFTKSGNGNSTVLTLQNAPNDLLWSQFTVADPHTNCTVVGTPAGTAAVAAGLTLSFADNATSTGDDCDGLAFSIVHKGTNGISYSTTL